MEDLILTVLSGEATLSERRSLDQWRNESPENERVYQEYARTWQVLPLHASQEPVSAPPPLEQIIAAGDRRRQKTVPLSGTAKPHSRTLWWAAVAVASAAAVIFLVGVSTLRSVPPDLTFATGPNETITIPLEDGSVVRLGPGSQLDVWMTGKVRKTTFHGSGFFAIASDSTSPFVIHTDAGTAEVLGTRFEIRTSADSLRLLVVEGRVALSAVGQKVEVGRGEMAHASSSVAPSQPQTVNVWEMLDWQEGILIYQDTPLFQVAAEVERFFGVPVSITDTALTRRVVTAWFGNEPFEDVIGTICQVVGARCTLGEGVEIAQ